MFRVIKKIKDRFYIDIIAKLIIGFILVFGITVTSMYVHEVAHIRINSYYGIDSELHWNIHSPYVMPLEKPPNDALFAHAVNDAVGYQLLPFFVGLCILLVFSIVEIATTNRLLRDYLERGDKNEK